jgi:hypothetical protein
MAVGGFGIGMNGYMPHFYFELVSKSGATMDPDESGADFPSVEAAIQDAEKGYADLLAEALTEGRPVEFAAIDVRDGNRHLVETLRFDDHGARILGKEPGAGN